MPKPNYEKDAEENQEFDKTLNPQGTFEKPSVEQLKEGVKIRNKSRYRSGEGSQDFLNKSLQIGASLVPNTPAEIAETTADAKATHTAAMLGGSILGEYLPLPEGTGAAIGGAVGYAASKLKRGVTTKLSDIVTDALSKTRIFGKEYAGDARLLGNWGYADDLAEQSAQPMLSKSSNPLGSGYTDIPLKVQYQMGVKSGLRDGVFDLETWRANGSNRSVMELFQTQPSQAIRATGKNSMREVLMPGFLEEYGPYLKKFGIKESSINLHHIFAVNISAPLFDGLKFGSKEWDNLLRVLLKEGVQAGNVPKNLKLLTKPPHDLVHKYYRNVIGNEGEIFFTPERMALLRQPGGRTKVAKEYAKLVKQSELIVGQAQDVFKKIYGSSTPDPDGLVDALSALPIDRNYQLNDINKIVREVITELDARPLGDKVPEIFTKVIQGDPKGFAMLSDAIGLNGKPLTSRQLKKRYANYNPDQMELALEEVTPTVKNTLSRHMRLIKEQGRSGKGSVPMNPL